MDLYSLFLCHKEHTTINDAAKFCKISRPMLSLIVHKQRKATQEVAKQLVAYFKKTIPNAELLISEEEILNPKDETFLDQILMKQIIKKAR